MAHEFSITFYNTNGGGSKNEEQPQTAKKVAENRTSAPNATESALSKQAIANIGIAVNAATNIYTTATNTQASLQGNSAYAERVQFCNSLLTSAVSAATGVGAAFLIGGPVFGGVAAVASLGVKVASTGIKHVALKEKSNISDMETSLAVNRLGGADNVWRK